MYRTIRLTILSLSFFILLGCSTPSSHQPSGTEAEVYGSIRTGYNLK